MVSTSNLALKKEYHEVFGLDDPAFTVEFRVPECVCTFAVNKPVKLCCDEDVVFALTADFADIQNDVDYCVDNPGWWVCTIPNHLYYNSQSLAGPYVFNES